MSALHSVEPAAQRDLNEAERAAGLFLRSLGLDTDSPDLVDTPRRMTQAYGELTGEPTFEPTTFANDGNYAGLVLARAIPLQSVCEHHFLPFWGTAHIGYIPGDRLLGLSKLGRLTQMFARRPQVQERLTTQIAQWLNDNVAPLGVGVVIDAEHTCMTMRGVRALGSTTRTSVFTGTLRTNPGEFLLQI